MLVQPMENILEWKIFVEPEAFDFDKQPLAAHSITGTGGRLLTFTPFLDPERMLVFC
jgi:hypothetical protein